MIETLISSKTRIKLLLKFFLNSNNKGYLRGLEEEFGESTNAIRLELNRFEQVGMITSDIEGNKKFFKANTKHPLFSDIHNIIKKYIGIDTIIENIINQLGEVESVLNRDFANGINNNNIIDLEFVGNINVNYLVELVNKAETLIKRKIRYVVYSAYEYAMLQNTHASNKKLLIWRK
ncbi:MAG: ArsR family transcriptional regulator [Chitinophagaceae bacterium]|nr:ArsR family transcriptional regulator [Chitinophagaceae bacterium]